jgi:hypothetical protein
VPRRERVSISGHDVDKGVRCTENAALSRGYQLIASRIVKLFNLCVSMTPQTVLNVPALRLLMNVVGINIGRSNSSVPNHGPKAPVERVILPDDSLQSRLICNITNAVLY